MTKKILLASLVFSTLTFPALAENLSFAPYVGVDIGGTSYSYNKAYNVDGDILNVESLLDNNLNNINLHAGSRFGKYIGAEIGYFRSDEGKKNIATGDSVGQGLVAASDFSTKLKTHGVSLDALGYLPLTDDARIEAIGTAGLTWTKATINFVDYGSESTSEIGFRMGGGAQYHITNDISARGLVRYQTADFDDTAEHAWTYSMGLNYSF